jgi:hypothetical protein
VLISDKELAKEIASDLLEASNAIDRTVGAVRESASNDEFLAYREAASKVLAEMLFELLNPIYRDHPEIRPEGWE